MKRTIGLVVALGLAACGGTNLDISVSEDNLCAEIAEVACHNAYTCCSEGEIEQMLGVDEPRTEAECNSDIRRLCERNIATREWSVENGRARLDTTLADGCLEALVVEDTCALVDTDAPWAEACATTPWVGLVADGGECFYEYECAGGVNSYCAANRKCTPLPGENQACTGQNCQEGLFCDGGTCHVRLPVGQPCDRHLECDAALYCDFLAEPASVCAARKPIGEACLSDDVCTSDNCLPGICAGQQASPCYQDDDCNNRCEDDGGFCVVDSNCGPGHCTLNTATVCTSNAGCTGGEDLCIFEIQCLPPECVGDPVCAADYSTSDYCEDALGALPVSFGGFER